MKRHRPWICLVIIITAVLMLPRVPAWFKSAVENYWDLREQAICARVLRNQNELEILALETAETGMETTYGRWEVTWEEEDQIVKFLVSYTGLVPASVERGVFVSKDIPQTLMGLTFDCTLGRQEEGYVLQYTGDGNTLHVHQIAPHWFWYAFYW